MTMTMTMTCAAAPERLIAAGPETLFLTDRDRHYPYVRVRLSQVCPGRVERLIERRWRATAPKTLLKAWDALRSETA